MPRARIAALLSRVIVMMIFAGLTQVRPQTPKGGPNTDPMAALIFTVDIQLFWQAYDSARP